MRDCFIKKLISVMLLIGILFVFGYRLFNQDGLIESLKSIDTGTILALAGLNSFILWINVVLLKKILAFFKLILSFRACTNITILTTMGNYLTSLSGGTFSKALYLRKKHDFPYSSFIASMSGVYILNLFIAALLGVSGLLLIRSDYGDIAGTLLCLLIAFIMSILFCLLLDAQILEGNSKVLQFISEVISGLQLLRRERGLIFQISMLIFVKLLLSVAEIIIVYKLFAINLSVSAAFLMVLFGVFSTVVKITPGNLGIYEGALAFGSTIAGFGPDRGFMVAGLTRATYMIITMLFGILLLPKLFIKGNLANENKKLAGMPEKGGA